MASLFFHLFLLSTLLFTVSSLPASAQPNLNPSFITQPIFKDLSTRQYYTSVAIGTPKHKMNLVIDLEGNFLWFDCNTHYNSSSYHPLSCGSEKCPESSPCIGCDGFPSKPGCTNNTCGVLVTNSLAGFSFIADLGEDFLYLSNNTILPRYLAGCSDSDRFSSSILVNLAKGTKGIVGFSRSHLALPIQLSSIRNIIPKFALCLPSSKNGGTGEIFFAGGPWRPTFLARISFVTTRGDQNQYFINVNSINIDDEVVKFNNSLLSIDDKGNGGTKFSTMNPYTILHHSIYKPFVRLFVKKAADRKIKRVASVAPFSACFDAKTVDQINTGPAVPPIDFVVYEGGRHIEIFGHNSMVEAKKGVLCLAFVDGGKNAETSVVFGGHQWEDKILEFDLSTSILSYSSSLLLRDASCSDPQSLVDIHAYAMSSLSG